MRRALWLLSLGLVLLGIALVAVGFGVRLNVMRSAPLGLYRMGALNGVPTYDQLVLFWTEEAARLMRERHGWMARQWDIVKPIAALPGDRVCHEPSGIVVYRRNGEVKPYGPVLLDDAHPSAGGCLTVPRRHAYLASPHVGSLDSRYVGCVPFEAVRGHAQALWTW
jgi:type IV secretory pathway protease TraF